MLRTVVLAGLASVSLADVERKDKAIFSLFDLSGAVKQTGDAMLDVRKRISALNQETGSVAAAVNLIGGVDGRIDALATQVGQMSGIVEGESIRIRSEIDQKATNNYFNMQKAKVNYDLTKQLRTVQKQIDATAQSIGDRAAVVNDQVTGMEGYVQGKMDALTAKLDVAMKELQSNMPNYQNADHIEQVTGIKWKDGVDKYWDRKVYTADSEFSHVTGRHYYKILFNLKKPGYWTYMSEEMFLACKALSMYFQDADGVERDLAPICNHHGHPYNGGLGDCAYVREIYASHNHNGGGYWGWRRSGGGVKENVWKNILAYESLNHNNAHHFSNDGGNRHSWRFPMRDTNWKYIVCTSRNRHYRTLPSNVDFQKCGTGDC